jgi:hypothetical protein
MSTHANIYLPVGKLVIYKHHDGRPKDILPVLSHVVNESSIFMPSYRGKHADWRGEMGYLAHRIVSFFAVSDFMRRSLTGIRFTERDISSIVSPMAILTQDNMAAQFEYRIQKNGDISFFNMNSTGNPRVLPYKTDMKNVLNQLAAIGADDQ